MRANWITLFVAAVAVVSTPAQAEWTTRQGGDFGMLVSNANADGDELFVYCAQQGLNVGFVLRVSSKPGGPSDLTKVRVAVSVDGRPATPLTIEGYDGAWVSMEPTSFALANALLKSGSATVRVADDYAEAFEASAPEFALAGSAAALAKAGFPARCRPK
jgi:hypothetical protein